MKRIFFLLVLGARVPCLDAQNTGTESKVIATGVKPLQLHRIAQVINSAGEPVLDIEEHSRSFLPFAHSSETVYRLTSGDRYTLYNDHRGEPKPRVTLRLVMPSGEVVLLEIGASEPAKVAQAPQTEVQEALISAGGKTFKVDVARPLKPQFESKEGQAFRDALPASGYALMDVIEDGAKTLEEHGLWNGYPSVFLVAYTSDESPKGRDGWEVRELRKKYEVIDKDEAAAALRAMTDASTEKKD